MSSKAVLALAAALMAGSAHAGTRCELTLKPETSGFFMSPTIDSLTVVEAADLDPETPCMFLAGDELLQINEQVIPGRKAREVMKYWESVPEDATLNFSIRRDEQVIPIVID